MYSVSEMIKKTDVFLQNKSLSSGDIFFSIPRITIISRLRVRDVR